MRLACNSQRAHDVSVMAFGDDNDISVPPTLILITRTRLPCSPFLFLLVDGGHYLSTLPSFPHLEGARCKNRQASDASISPSSEKTGLPSKFKYQRGVSAAKRSASTFSVAFSPWTQAGSTGTLDERCGCATLPEVAMSPIGCAAPWSLINPF